MRTESGALARAAARVNKNFDAYVDTHGAVNLVAIRDVVARERGADEPIMLGDFGLDDNMDIMALAFLVMMAAAKDAREDLKEIMAGVKAINHEKERWREVLRTLEGIAGASASAGRIDCNVVPCAHAKALRFLPVGAAVLDGNQLLINTPRRDGTTEAGLTVCGGDHLTAADLKATIDKVEHKIDEMSEMGEMQSLRLQMAMDRMSKMMSTLSNLLKKMSDTAQSVVGNLK